MNAPDAKNYDVKVPSDINQEMKNSDTCFISLTKELGMQFDSPLMVLATRAMKEWQRRAAATDAMVFGAGITNSLKSYKDFCCLQSSHGLQRLVVVSAGRPQFKLVHRSITIPKKLAAKYKIGAGPIRVRLYIKARGEIWTGPDADQSFTASWLDLPQKYKISLSKEHEAGQRPDWTFWYKPSQSGSKAKKAAVELLAGLDEMLDANLAATSMDFMMSYIRKQN